MEEIHELGLFGWILKYYLKVAASLTEDFHGYYTLAAEITGLPVATVTSHLKGDAKRPTSVTLESIQRIAQNLKMDPYAAATLRRTLQPKFALPEELPKSPQTDLEPKALLVKAGQFYYGEIPDQRYKFEQLGGLPEHKEPQLWLGDFYCCREVITQALWAKFVEDVRSHGEKIFDDIASHFSNLNDAEWSKYITMRKPGFDPCPKTWDSDSPPQEKHPVVSIDWHQANMFAAWISFISGRRWRLPYESQWEKAARGPDGILWPWGNDYPSVEWCNFLPEHRQNVEPSTVPANWEGKFHNPQVRSYYGMLNMAGNVWELTNTNAIHPPGPWRYDEREDIRKSNVLIARGGSYLDSAAYIRCSYRTANNCTGWGPNRGFRLVCEPPDFL